MPPTSGDTLKNSDIYDFGSAGVLLGYGMVVAMSLVISGYCSFLIRERQKKFKHMQVIVKFCKILKKEFSC